MSDKQQERINISVIIPHYNDAEGLFRLVQSIPKDGDIETIIVDDYSNDEVYDNIIKEYQKWQIDRNISVYQNDAVKSAGTCRNIGLRKAKGKWILFADADDYYKNDFFDYIKLHLDSESDIVFTKTDSYSENPERASTRHVHFNQKVDEYLEEPTEVTEMIMKLITVPWGKLIRKSFIDENNILFDNVRYSNDVMFATKTAVYAKTVTVEPRAIYIITEKDGTLTRVWNKESYDIRKMVAIRRHIFLCENVEKKILKEIGMQYQGFRFVLSPIVNKYGFSLAIKYLKMMVKAKAPLIIW